MIRSMTGFASASEQIGSTILIYEIRTVNHRYLDLTIRLPDFFYEQDALVRELIARAVKRGKLECTLKYQAISTSPQSFVINQPLVEILKKANQELKNIWPELGDCKVDTVLNWPSVLQREEVDKEHLLDVSRKLLEKAINELVKAREREGSNLKKLLNERLQKMRELIEHIKTKIPQLEAQQKNKILTRVAELGSVVDHDRIEQEMLLLLYKMDIAEEVDRLQAHISEIERVLDNDQTVGRKLDFFMQELNREVNTLGSKSSEVDVSHIAVELKVLIEQMREQIQNIE